jgi:hypothetical protein
MNSVLVRLCTASAALVTAIALLAAGAGALPAGLTGVDLARAAGAALQAQTFDATANYESIAQRAAELRGLPLRQEVTRTVLSPDQFRARMVDELNNAESLESIENSRRLMVKLGLLAPDLDLYALELEFRTGVVLGQYDPETKQLYVISGNEGVGQLERVTLAHELTHALQDQHYDIRKLMPKDSDNSDRDLAVSSLLEGDALILEEMYQNHVMTRQERDDKRRQERSLSSSVRFDRLPLVIVEETYFPYTEGPRFMINALGADAIRTAITTGTGYAELVNRLFENPPTSTAQIIHPEKYLAGAQPIPVAFPDLAAALGEGWKQARKDLLGEIDHRILIQQLVNRELGDRAAAGWAGDAFALLIKGEESVVVVKSEWDSAAEAREWYDAYTQAVQARYGNRLQVAEQRPDRVAWRTPDGMHVLSLSGTTTHILITSTPEQVGALERALGVTAAPAMRRLAPSLRPAR